MRITRLLLAQSLESGKSDPQPDTISFLSCLPFDIILYIIQFLDTPTLKNFTLINRVLRREADKVLFKHVRIYVKYGHNMHYGRNVLRDACEFLRRDDRHLVVQHLSIIIAGDLGKGKPKQQMFEVLLNTLNRLTRLNTLLLLVPRPGQDPKNGQDILWDVSLPALRTFTTNANHVAPRFWEQHQGLSSVHFSGNAFIQASSLLPHLSSLTISSSGQVTLLKQHPIRTLCVHPCGHWWPWSSFMDPLADTAKYIEKLTLWIDQSPLPSSDLHTCLPQFINLRYLEISSEHNDKNDIFDPIAQTLPSLHLLEELRWRLSRDWWSTLPFHGPPCGAALRRIILSLFKLERDPISIGLNFILELKDVEVSYWVRADAEAEWTQHN